MLRLSRALFLPLTLALLAGVAAPSVAMADGPRLAYVDMRRAIESVGDGKKMKSQLEKKRSASQARLDAEMESFKKKQEALQAQRAMMKDDVLRAKEQELGQQMQALQMTYAKLQKDLAQEEVKLVQGVTNRMRRILVDMAKREGIAMVFEVNESGLLWAPEHMDLTNELIRRYEAGEGKGGGKPKKGGKGKKGK